MIAITHEGRYPDLIVHRAAVGLLGDATTGVSGMGNRQVIWLHDWASPAQQATAQGVFAAVGTLSVAANKTTIAADGVDESTITVNTGDAELDYIVYRNGAVWAEGSEPAVGGVVTLIFATEAGGIYQIWVMRDTGNFASGSVTITAG